MFCTSCISSLGLSEDCQAEDAGEGSCWTVTTICGNSVYYTESAGTIVVIDSVPPLTLCLWTLDLRGALDVTGRDYLFLNVSLGEQPSGPPRLGNTVVAAYTLYTKDSYPALRSFVPQLFMSNDGTDVSSSLLLKSIKANYM